MQDREVLALTIFAFTYLLILAGENSPRKLDRPTAGLLAAVLMVATGVLSRREAAASLDLGTLALLFAMMLLVGFAVRSGLLDEWAARLVVRSHSPLHLLWIVVLAAGGLSALFVNDTVCLMMTPLLLAVTKRDQLPPEPYLLALATDSNVGSMITLTGNPQNMLIGQSSGWGWAAFALHGVVEAVESGDGRSRQAALAGMPSGPRRWNSLTQFDEGQIIPQEDAAPG